MNFEHPYFTSEFKKLLEKLLVKHLGEKNLNTEIEFINRKSHAYSFLAMVLNNIPPILTDYNFANYKIDDSNDFRFHQGFAISERKRLVNDIETCENILCFLAEKMYFKA